MLENFIQSLDDFVRGDARKIEPSPEFVIDYSRSPRVLQALERVEETAYTTSATSSMYVDQRIEYVEHHGRWTALVLRVPALLSSISTAAFGSVVYVASAETPLLLRTFNVDGFPADGDIPGKMALRHLRDFELTEGDVFVLPPAPTAVRMEGDVHQARFLRFSEEVRVPLTASFDPSNGALRTVAHSDETATGEHFFATLLLEMIKNSNRSSGAQLSSDDLKSVSNFAEFALKGNAHLVTKWKFIQMAAKLNPGACRRFLWDLAASPLPHASAKARAVLQRNESVQ